jgi:hypothetical protein
VQDFSDMQATGCTTTFVAVDEGRIKGMITVMDYGRVGWISNMLVEKASRGKKLGGDLLEEGIKALGEKQTITLFAYMDAKRFYLRHGFRCDRDFPLVRFIGGRKGSAREGGSTEEVFAMDEKCFGFSRRGLLRVLMGKGRTKRGGIRHCETGSERGPSRTRRRRGERIGHGSPLRRLQYARCRLPCSCA